MRAAQHEGASDATWEIYQRQLAEAAPGLAQGEAAWLRELK